MANIRLEDVVKKFIKDMKNLGFTEDDIIRVLKERGKTW